MIISVGLQHNGRTAEAGKTALGHAGASSEHVDEATSFSQDIEAAAAAASLQGETGEVRGGTYSGSGSTAGRRRQRCDLWWLLAIPAAVLLLLAAREWQTGFSSTTAVLARVRSMQPRRQSTDPWQMSKQQAHGGQTHRTPGADVAFSSAGQIAPGPLDEAPGTAPATPAPQPEPGQLPAAGSQPEQQQQQQQQPQQEEQPQQPAPAPQQAEDRRQAPQQAPPEDGQPPHTQEDGPEMPTPADSSAGLAPASAIGPSGSGNAIALELGAVAAVPAPSTAPTAADGPSEPASDGPAGYGAAAALPSVGAPHSGLATGATPPAAVGPAVVVLPSQYCQVVKPEVEQHCMASGAASPKCRAAVKGQYSASYLSPFVRIAPHMAAQGFGSYIVNSVSKRHKPGDGSAWDAALAAADIVILEEKAVERVMAAYPNKTYVALQGNAAAAMQTCAPDRWCAQHLLERPQVARFLQHTGLLPIQLNNAQRYMRLPHYHLMQQVHLDGIPEAELDWGPAQGQAAFSTAMLAKAQTLNPMFWRWRYPMTCHGKPEWAQLMAPALEAGSGGAPPDFLPSLSDRTVDVAFSGSVAPPAWRDTESQRVQNGLYAAHRQALLDELAAIQKRNPQLRVRTAAQTAYPEFVQLLRSTRIFISPLGHGEYSGKDYEAIISRALLVKPLARHLQSYPDIYDVNVTCIEVAMDFSNLEAVLQGLLADPQWMQTIADAAYGRLVEYSDPRRVAADVGAMLHDVAAQAGLRV